MSSSTRRTDMFSTLPTELVEHIADYAKDDPASLCALRLTCRKAHTESLRAFVNTFESIAIFPCYKPSLDVALRIAQHEHFGPKVRNVTIMVDEVSPYAPKTAFENHGELRYHKRDSNQLVTIFKALGARGPLNMMQFMESKGNSLPGVICGKAQMTREALPLALTPENDHVFHITALALAIQDQPTFSSIIVQSKEAWTLPIHSVMARRESHATYTLLLSQLKHLEITTWTAVEMYENPLAIRFAQCFSAAHNLKTLSIRTIRPDDTISIRRDIEFDYDNAVDDFSFVKELLRQTLPSLEVLKIRGADIEVAHLTDFICRHKELGSLSAVELSYIRFEVYRHIPPWEDMEAALKRLTSFGNIEAWKEVEKY